MEFKDKLKKYRKDNNLTQTELAHKLGIDFTTVNRLENGHFNPSYEVLTEFDLLTGKVDEDLFKLPTLPTTNESDDIFNDISNLIVKSKNIAYQSVNILLIKEIG